jgi:hypothetical protein
MSRPLPRFTDQTITHDPLTKALAQREAAEAKARAAIAKGHTPDADPADLRGIPCIARGVGGTSPGTNPATAILHLDHRLTR